MKPLITALLLILGSRIYAVAPVLSVTYVLSWQDPSVPPLDHFAPNTNSLYKLYSTATIGIPATNWPLVAVFTNWTLGTNGGVWFTNTWQGPPQDTFFYLTASNFFGEQPSFFAPLVHSGPLGLNPTNTTLGLQ